MKQLVHIAVWALPFLYFSCGSKTETDASAKPPAETAKPVDGKLFEGEYTGNFGDGHIVLVLSYVQGKNVSGYNVHKGLRRNIKGTLDNADGTYRFRLDEPGDHPYDGKFDFTLDPQTLAGKGSWKPNDAAKLKERTFELQRRQRDAAAESEFVGFWDGSEMLEIKDDGLAELSFWEYPEGNEEGELRKIRGQWIAEGNKLTLEWAKNPYGREDKSVLFLKKDQKAGYIMLADKSQEHEYYQY